MKTNIEQHQEQLRAASGTPEQFATNALALAEQGLTSVPEAEEAICKYQAAYYGAPISDAPLSDAPDQVDLSLFCSTDLSKPYLSTSWNSQGYTYASDGRIIVRVSARTEWEGNGARESFPTPGFREAARKMFLPFTKHPETSFVALPDAPKQTCSECGGKGAITGTNGWTPCFGCDETGMVYDPAWVQVGVRRIAARYFALLRGLPGILVASEQGGRAESLPFVFTGGSGFVMPLDFH